MAWRAGSVAYAAPKSSMGTGAFSISNGTIYDPKGNIYVAKGINIYDWQTQWTRGISNSCDVDGTWLRTQFSGINFVRLAAAHGHGRNNLTLDRSGYNDDPANFATFIQAMTGYNTAGQSVGAHYAVVAIEDHLTNGAPMPTSGPAIAWYEKVANHYKNNPYVWYGTTNEPSGSPDSQQGQFAIYNAIRGAGATAPIMLTMACSGAAGKYSGFQAAVRPPASTYATLRNVIWDAHAYSWQFGTDGRHVKVTQSYANSEIQKWVSIMQGSVTSADGMIPIIFGEYGTSTSGSGVDASGAELVLAVQNVAPNGCAAWSWFSQLPGSDNLTIAGRRTAYGNEVAAYIAGNPPSSWTDTDGS